MKKLINALTLASTIINRKVIDKVLLEAGDDLLTIKATDGVVYFTAFLGYPYKEFSCVVDPKLLLKVLKEIKNGRINVVDNELVVSDGKSSVISLPALHRSEASWVFSEFPLIVSEGVETSSQAFSRATKKVAYAVAKEERASRRALEYVYIKSSKWADTTSVIASDGYRLAVYEDYLFKGKIEAFIYRSALKVLQGLPPDGTIVIANDEGYSHFTYFPSSRWYSTLGTLSIVVKNPDDEYPDVDEVMKTIKFRFDVGVKTDLLKWALKRVKSGSVDKNEVTALTITPEYIRVSTSSSTVGVEIDKNRLNNIPEEGATIKFNLKYLIEAIEQFETPFITIYWGDVNNPVMFSGSEPYSVVIMPILQKEV